MHDVTASKSVCHTLGVEIECFCVDKQRFNELCTAKGVELQTESYNHNTKPHFKIVSDSSIQGENAIECVTPVLRNKAGFDNLEKVCDALNEVDALVNRSPACTFILVCRSKICFCPGTVQFRPDIRTPQRGALVQEAYNIAMDILTDVARYYRREILNDRQVYEK
ncbi:MAG: amidoligase family protein [Dysgonamonadaceae bacterium]|nr:amidoligase family protein [Dysgonamonadaceae bacterium]